MKKKFLFKDFKPDDEFWEDCAHVARTIMPIIGQKRQQAKSESKSFKIFQDSKWFNFA